TLGNSLVKWRIVERGRSFDRIAKLFQHLLVNLGGEPAGVPGGAGHLHRRAFAGRVLSRCRRKGTGAQQSGGSDGGHGILETEHVASPSRVMARARTPEMANRRQGTIPRPCGLRTRLV